MAFSVRDSTGAEKKSEARRFVKARDGRMLVGITCRAESPFRSGKRSLPRPYGGCSHPFPVSRGPLCL
jgi:hypothetical protein